MGHKAGAMEDFEEATRLWSNKYALKSSDAARATADLALSFRVLADFDRARHVSIQISEFRRVLDFVDFGI